ncbi:MAG: hydrogenase nickel incorporation protein HypB [Phormidesmis sp.]
MCGSNAHKQCGCRAVGVVPPPESTSKILNLRQNVLAKNDDYAARNRASFHRLLMLNVLSSPGSGKTTLIQRLLRDLSSFCNNDTLPARRRLVRAGVIVGDLATDRDAERLRQTGTPTVQITTGNLCHLEADSVAKAAKQLDVDNLDLLMVENVGNLVCPAAYDLGEDLRMVLMSVTEGEDKPFKYPTMFKSAQIIVISKSDLADAVNFQRTEALQALAQIAPQAQIFELSALTGQGLDRFYAYLGRAMVEKVGGKTLAEVG